MISMRIDGIDALQRNMGGLSRQMPFITAKALNDVAFKIQSAELREITDKVDRVKPWTVRQMRVKRATKQDISVIIGSQESMLGFEGALDRTLYPHVFGGKRNTKKAERALSKLGLMPKGWVAVPGDNSLLDQYGNLPRAAWNKLVKLRNSKKLFVSQQDVKRTKRLSPGIYERYGRNHRVRKVVEFVPSATYQKNIRLKEMATRTVNQELNAAFSRAMVYAQR